MKNILLTAALLLIVSMVVLTILFAQEVVAQIKLVGMLLLMAFSFLGLLFLFFGNQLVRIMPTVTRFRNAQQRWGELNIDSSRIARPSMLRDVVEWRFEEISDGSNPTDRLNEVKHYSVGKLATVVARQPPAFRNLTRELQAYSATFVTLFVAGILLHLKELGGKDLTAMANIVFSESTIPVLEAVTIVYLVIRLASEMGWINSIIDGE